eukprot:TRINITY_DN15028_c0_g1_i1.p1 TRINITY_DN15028_c0_g1~~TRINITY_DN15028_c0_g1_i1.p1  ORF type:complete len:895 (+),score=291.23 TRINITY_DN15028_c0_g1_i1:89-2773(+)
MLRLCVLACLVLMAAGGTVKYMAYNVGTKGHEALFEQFQEETGHVLDVSVRDNTVLLPEIEHDLTQDHLFDVYMTYSEVLGYGDKGLAHDISGSINDGAFAWSDIAVVAREMVTFGAGVFSVPVDSNPIPLVFRRDLIDAPPRTWEELIDVASKWHGEDINNDTVPDYGVCFINKGRFQLLAFTVANTVFRHHVSERDGFLYDVPTEDGPMESLIQTEGWAYVLDIVKQLYSFSPKHPIAAGLPVYQHWMNGTCAMFLTFPSVAEMVTREPPSAGFDIRGKQGVTRAPGSTKVYNRATQRLEPCNTRLCPLEEYGNVNRPSYNDGGLQLLIRKGTPNLAAALDFAAYMTKHVDVRIAGAVNPFRANHWNVSEWEQAAGRGWLKEEALQYTSTLFKIISSPRTATRPRVPNARVYNAKVDAALDEHLRRGIYASSNATVEEILRVLDEGMVEQSTALGYLPDEVERYWRLDQGLPMRKYPAVASIDVFTAVIVAALLGTLAIAAALVAFQRRRAQQRKFMVRHAPRGGVMCFAFTDIKQSSSLWSDYPAAMAEALATHHQICRRLITAHSGYEVKTIGDSFMCVFSSPVDTVAFLLELQVALLAGDWPPELEKHPACRQEGLVFRGLRVRAGAHIGTAVVQETPQGGFDYTGTDVNITARIADAGAGGQVLLTEALFEAVAPRLDEVKISTDASYVGTFRYRGIADPVKTCSIAPDALKDREFEPMRGVVSVDDEEEDRPDAWTAVHAPTVSKHHLVRSVNNIFRWAARFGADGVPRGEAARVFEEGCHHAGVPQVQLLEVALGSAAAEGHAAVRNPLSREASSHSMTTASEGLRWGQVLAMLNALPGEAVVAIANAVGMGYSASERSSMDPRSMSQVQPSSEDDEDEDVFRLCS